MKSGYELLNGAIDMHQHLGPSVIPRALDVIEAVIEAKNAGMAGIVVKDHQTPTAPVAEMTQKHFGGQNFKVFSGIVLNSFVGGLNTDALETAANMGSRLVWMPTISTENHHVKHALNGLNFPASKGKLSKKEPEYIQLIDGNKNVTPDVYKILEIIAERDELILATGHGSWEEVDCIIKTAVKLGISKILVNHPAYMVDASLEKMIEWANLGAFMEFGVCTSDPISKIYHVDIDETAKYIKEIGAERVIIVSDLGQVNNPKPVDGLTHFNSLLMERGLTDDEIKIMIKDNPRKLLGL